MGLSPPCSGSSTLTLQGCPAYLPSSPEAGPGQAVSHQSPPASTLFPNGHWAVRPVLWPQPSACGDTRCSEPGSSWEVLCVHETTKPVKNLEETEPSPRRTAWPWEPRLAEGARLETQSGVRQCPEHTALAGWCRVESGTAGQQPIPPRVRVVAEQFLL